MSKQLFARVGRAALCGIMAISLTMVPLVALGDETEPDPIESPASEVAEGQPEAQAQSDATAATPAREAATYELSPGRLMPVGSELKITGSFDTSEPIAAWGEVWVASQGRWSPTSRRSTNSNGDYTITTTFWHYREGNQRWRVGALHTDGEIQYTEEFTITRRNASVSIPSVVPTGTTATISGRFPTEERIRVWGQVWIASEKRWSSTPSVTSSADGRYQITTRFWANKTGTQRWRVAARHVNGFVQYSDSKTLRRADASVSVAPRIATGISARITGRFPVSRPITVWGEVWIASERRWSRTPAVTTNSSGAYTISTKFWSSRAMSQTWRVAGRHATGEVQYTSRVHFSRAKASISTTSVIPVGETASLRGRFPTSSPVTVWGEVWLSDERRWSRTPGVRTTSRGDYRIDTRFWVNKPGTQIWRVGGTYPGGETHYTSSVALKRVDTTLDPRCLTGRVLCIDKDDRKLRWVINGRVISTMDARFGRPGMETREGTFSVYYKSRNHVSSLYGSSMPYAMFFSGGQAVHYSADFSAHGYNGGGSHGCVNIRDRAKVAWLFDQVSTGTKVVVYD